MLAFGRIVWAEVADANGIRKVRPAVVITPTDEINEAGPLEVVASRPDCRPLCRKIMSCYPGTLRAILALG